MTATRYDQASHGFGPFSEDAVPVCVPVYWNGTAWALGTAANATHVVVDSSEDVLWVIGLGEFDRQAQGFGYPLGLDLGVLYPHASNAGEWQNTDPGGASLFVEVVTPTKILVRRVTAGGGGGVTDHGALTGLGDDDHTQYHNDARGDARYYQKSEVDAKVVTPYPGAFIATGSTNIVDTADTTVGLGTKLFDPDANYVLASDEITVAVAGYYRISYSIPVNDDGSAGAQRGRVYAWVEKETVAIAQSRSQCYHRETGDGSGVSASFIALLAADDTIRLRVRVSSTVDVSTESAEATLSIERIRAA